MSNPLRDLFTRRTAIVATLVTLSFVGLLIAEGRPWTCKSGFALWAAARTRCTSQNFLDPYSVTHVLHGVILFWMLIPFAGKVSLPWRLFAALVLEISWELLENSPSVIAHYRQDTAALDYTGDSILNSLGDLLSVVAGFAVASRFSGKVSVALFVTLELWMLWVSRDNLMLNVLMLLYPIEAIKEWQLGALAIPH